MLSEEENNENEEIMVGVGSFAGQIPSPFSLSSSFFSFLFCSVFQHIHEMNIFDAECHQHIPASNRQ